MRQTSAFSARAAESSVPTLLLLLGMENKNKPGARKKIRRQLFIRRQGPAEQGASSR